MKDLNLTTKKINENEYKVFVNKIFSGTICLLESPIVFSNHLEWCAYNQDGECLGYHDTIKECLLTYF